MAAELLVKAPAMITYVPSQVLGCTLSLSSGNTGQVKIGFKGHRMELSHINASGEANMVDVGDKQFTERSATASGIVKMLPSTLQAIKSDALKKGEVLAVARIAGIQVQKSAEKLIPLCHLSADKGVGLFLMKYPTVNLKLSPYVGCAGKQVEMEALTAVSVACLTVYDMCKAVDKGMTIEAACLEEKLGGKSVSGANRDGRS